MVAVDRNINITRRRQFLRLTISWRIITIRIESTLCYYLCRNIFLSIRISSHDFCSCPRSWQILPNRDDL